MFRFILIFGMALFWLNAPAYSKEKPKPPAISACRGKICITSLRWGRPSSFDGSLLPYIEGTLVNGSSSLLRGVSLAFAMKLGEAGTDLIGTALAAYAAVIPPGGRWHFRAPFEHLISGVYVGRTESVTLTMFRDPEDVTSMLRFDPVFNPDNRGAIKRWEKIHGKRQR